MPGLRDYLLDLGVGQSRPVSRAGAVIRGDLDHGPEYLAVIASGGRLDAAGLQAACDAFVRAEQGGGALPLPADLDPEGVAGFGSLFVGDGDLERVAALYRFAVALAGPDRRLDDLLLRVALQSNLVTGHHAFVREQLATRREVTPMLRWQLGLDLLRPENGGDLGRWQAHLDEVLTEHGQAPVTIDSLAFGGLRVLSPPPPVDGPLVTVVTATYRPGADLDVAVGSILAQTWQNLEVLLVDDCSGPESLARLEEVAARDPRVRVLQMPENGGTYRIRNRALQEARGDLVTFQDDDDWSHPERIARQAAPLVADPSCVATFSRSLRLTTDLHATYVGFLPVRKNESSLMVRRRPVLERLGGFDGVRKAGDSEFSERLATVFGPDAVIQLPDVLALVQLTQGSLSRGDFRYRWKHPAREEYRQSFMAWHHGIAQGRHDARLPREPRAFPAPHRFLGLPESSSQEADVVLVSGITDDEPRHHGLGDELALLSSLGTVGLLTSETVRYARMSPQRPSWRTLEALQHPAAARWRWQVPGRARLAVVRDPELLMLPPRTAVQQRADRVVVVAGYPPRTPEGRLAYAPAAAEAQARALFGGDVRWLPATPEVADALRAEGVERIDPPRPFLVAPSLRRRSAPRRSDLALVVGTTGVETIVLDRPSAEELLDVLAPSPRLDVRFRDALRAVEKIVRPDRWPPSWLVFERLGHDEGVEVVPFLNQLDVLVDFAPRTWGPALPWNVVAALARGVVPVVEPVLRPWLGDAAVYAERAGMRQVLDDLSRDPDRLVATREAGAALVSAVFSPSAQADVVRAWLPSAHLEETP